MCGNVQISAFIDGHVTLYKFYMPTALPYLHVSRLKPRCLATYGTPSYW